jgi:hypothetical protein
MMMRRPHRGRRRRFRRQALNVKMQKQTHSQFAAVQENGWCNILISFKIFDDRRGTFMAKFPLRLFVVVPER